MSLFDTLTGGGALSSSPSATSGGSFIPELGDRRISFDFSRGPGTAEALLPVGGAVAVAWIIARRL